jgi:signal transduction histidine kinase
MTLRRRLFAYLTGAAIAACVLTTGVAIVLVRHRLSAERSMALAREADVLAAAGSVPGLLPPGRHVFLLGRAGVRRVGPFLARALLAAVPARSASAGSLTVAGRSLLYAERASPAGRIVLVRSARFAFGEWRPFLLSLALAGLGGALLAAVSSWVLARRLVRPIHALSAATTRVAAGEPGVEVAADEPDELGSLARSFNLMSSRLALAREEQQAFLQSVSHELKTPLTSIRGYAEALGDRAIEPERAAPVILAEAGRLERLVSDLLELGRLRRPGFPVHGRPLDLAEVAATAVERHLPAARELSVRLSAAGEGPAPAIGDPDRLLQATSNLIENALRLTPAGGEVKVLSAPGSIVVEDSGPGLAEEDLPRAFERFYLHDRYRSDREVGSGLGLAIVHELAARMGGTVEVENRREGGARFRLRLPRPQAG